MRVFNYDKKKLSAIKAGNVVDIIELIADGLFALYLFTQFSNPRYDGNFVFTLLLIVAGVYFTYLVVKILSRFSTIYNLQQEKLEITQDGLIMTFVQMVSREESLKRIELPWEQIRYAESITKESFSFVKLNLLDLFTFNEEYKTIQIYTDKGTYKLFIEYSIDAVDMINNMGNRAYKEDNEAHTTWVCHNCNEVNEAHFRFCGICGAAKESKSEYKYTKTATSESSHKCTCGERFYGGSCPNCGREFK